MLTVNHLTKLLQIAILAAITYVLTLISIPVIPIVPYLKLDLSDLPILAGTVILGMSSGMSIAALATFLHLLTNGFALPTILGDGVMLIASGVMVLTLSGLTHFFSKGNSRDYKVLLVITITVNLTVSMVLVNLLAIPLEMKTIGMTIKISITKLIIIGIVPFNLIKGIIIGTLFLMIYRYLRNSNHFYS